MSDSWSLDEVERVVADYFAQFERELARRPYNKAEHTRQLRARLNGRTHGSVQFKYQNISAVLLNLGNRPYIPGYKPRQNYQLLLERAVLEWLAEDPLFFERAAESPMLDPVEAPLGQAMDPRKLVEPPPGLAQERLIPRAATGRIIDFVRRDAENRRLGRLGEEWALEFERKWLHDVDRKPDLARRVIWAAKDEGDGLGYDIRSFNADGSTKLIEVKTTGSGKHLPFYVTSNEVRVSEAEAERYHLYRVFSISSAPRLYKLHGPLSSVCRLDAAIYSARAR
jgi:hypothetical protein